jgi:hypothetical protein
VAPEIGSRLSINYQSISTAKSRIIIIKESKYGARRIMRSEARVNEVAEHRYARSTAWKC